MAARVAITGMGAITAAGVGTSALWRAVSEGRPCISKLDQERFPKARVKRAALVQEDVPQLVGDTVKKLDRFAQLALLAAREAVEQAGNMPQLAGTRTAVIVGSGLGGAETINRLTDAHSAGEVRVDPLTVPKVMASAAASCIATEYGIHGPVFCISSACASGAQATGIAMQMIRSGVVDRAIVGGAEALITPAVLRGWEVMRVLTPDLNRPFSADRNGMMLGEGAGILVLESAELAAARGKPPLAWLSGYGTACDAGDLLKPDAEWAARAMKDALSDAGLQPGDIGYVNAHGTGTVLNDVAEAAALDATFGEHMETLPVSSTKPVHGHTIAAAGAIELIITISALHNQFVPPTVNWTAEDPRCRMDVVANTGRKHEFRAALSNSFAFGGINTGLVVETAEEQERQRNV